VRQSCLIVGLGNPGSAYEGTRHNIGFEVVKRWAAEHGFSFRAAKHLSAELAQGSERGVKVALLLPMTYMNSSGEAVRLCAHYFKMPLSDLLIVCDDVALPFEEMRLRERGGTGGHKGLESIETHLGTQEYARLRIGVGDRADGDLADHVLGRFTEQEVPKLPEILEKATKSLDLWIFKRPLA
jgi:peptidyl-tRNA hydrolase, PTH1 family